MTTDDDCSIVYENVIILFVLEFPRKLNKQRLALKVQNLMTFDLSWLSSTR